MTDAVASLQGMKIVLWDYETDTEDWKGRSPEQIRAVVADNAKASSILLAHDRFETTDNALPLILDDLHTKGLCTR